MPCFSFFFLLAESGNTHRISENSNDKTRIEFGAKNTEIKIKPSTANGKGSAKFALLFNVKKLPTSKFAKVGEKIVLL